MRSAVLYAALALLAGCNPSSPPPAPRATTDPAALTPATPAPAATRAPTAGVAAAQHQRYRALGTEPFWGIDVLPGQLRYTAPDQPAVVSFAAQTSDGRRFTGTMAGQAVALVIAPGTCSDGMSDTVYAYTAQLTIGPQMLHGCAKAV